MFFVGCVIGVIWTSTEAPGSSVSGGFVAILWAAGILAALIVNPAYLRWRWHHSGRCTCSAHDSGFVPHHSGQHREPSPGGQPPTTSYAPPAASSEMLVIQDTRPSERPPKRTTIREEEPRPAPPTEARGWTTFAAAPADDAVPSTGDVGNPATQAPFPTRPEPEAQPPQPSEATSSEPPPMELPDEPAIPASLGDAVVRSAVYAQQKHVVRMVLDDSVLSRVIDEMSAVPGGRLNDEGMAAALGVPLSRLNGGVSCLARQVNVDGYSVVRRDGRWTVLDVQLLREQFRV